MICDCKDKRAVRVSMLMGNELDFFGWQSDRPLHLVDKATVSLALIHPNTCRGSFLTGKTPAPLMHAWVASATIRWRRNSLQMDVGVTRYRLFNNP